MSEPKPRPLYRWPVVLWAGLLLAVSGYWYLNYQWPSPYHANVTANSRVADTVRIEFYLSDRLGDSIEPPLVRIRPASVLRWARGDWITPECYYDGLLPMYAFSMRCSPNQSRGFWAYFNYNGLDRRAYGVVAPQR